MKSSLTPVLQLAPNIINPPVEATNRTPPVPLSFPWGGGFFLTAISVTGLPILRIAAIRLVIAKAVFGCLSLQQSWR